MPAERAAAGPPPAAAGRTDRRAPVVGLAVALPLMVLAMAVPALSGWDVRVRWFPPLHAEWRPRVGMGTAPAIVLAALGCWQATRLSERLPWRCLLAVTWVGGLAWMLSLALVDGVAGIGRILDTSYEYLPTARATTDLTDTLATYVERIPYAHPQNWPVHVAGHPPGALLFFVLLVRLGADTGLAAGLVVVCLAATTAPAVMVAARELGAETAARRALPFLVLGPAAVWQAVSADAVFAAVAAWGAAALAVAATRRSWVWSTVAGLLLGYCVMLSYGLPLLGFLAVGILLVARTWFPLPFVVAAALATVLAFAVAGFWWLEALPVLHERYLEGVGGRRPAAYWLWGSLAALLFATGPLLGSALASARHAVVASARRPSADPLAALVLAGLAMVLVADLSLMSKAEVERIWLPFVPWLMLACAYLPPRWRRVGLVGQVVFAIAVQHLLWSDW